MNELHAYPAIREIPFASSVIFVSGQTELASFPNWYKKYKGPSSREVQFYNFTGDNRLKYPLAVAIMFGIPWAVIADGNSFRSENTKGTKIPEIAQQIDEASELSGNYGKDTFKLEINEENWFSQASKELQKYGVFTLANCWRTNEKIKNKCSCCNSCEAKIDFCIPPEECKNQHTTTEKHQESFEDFVANDPELKNISLETKKDYKLDRAIELLQKHPECPSRLIELFGKVDNYLK